MATLRVIGDALDPDTVSQLLGGAPTRSCRKGDALPGSETGKLNIAKTGTWRMRAIRREPEDLNAQIMEILGQLTQELSVWSALRSRFRVDMFCGIFMAGGNDGLPLSAEVLLALGQRGIDLNLDIHDASED
ncbi:MAG: DUF4279 domain-containing protein [Xanthomonadales bacterium]|jgi:hypothetical protein|nr:DUF4279 domain-containing protein [Xanthomonadales bacterium]